VSTRKQRHHGNRQRGFEELNRSYGLNGRLESETWYCALVAVRAGTYNAAEDALVQHFGSIDLAVRSFEAIEDNVAQRYQEVIDVVT
jgi:hypothetical protein